ncbi:MAG: Cof-type HAD-IIB family hydrolase [Bacillota bacterium]|uniref:Cof-type HAD-IIB family hydrolase n=1 Tax=Virgibacillus salarius TaxID=447199 RepID=A0A941DQY7_9BACI|nr:MULTISPECIES: Cof-type HAD-IIB family hydrolase [Bacillaceae]NAZ07725.1 Cof-type HAD-IIB family hydrolase [Agaribacter marinus]MBR7795005.1 Cof-type HAD-IIB family hydrolase [Virgibacillus salarius]MCC2251203.1 Cof-type HAD-IIB family hydrolase [Virgibacillus sp. AGTR]MDY7045529.1 Cof-type HAD-IIB family hydrolase [Virgibacillus sp. M23]QRZ18714.1 Cof-type HAD-IIB family hydrolase [Virgibacillus sp. AGTR]
MQLIAIDLDGTLLSENGTISDENVQAIHEVQRKDDIVVISSGRSVHDTKEILRRAAIDCPIIAGNGAKAYDNDKLLYHLFLTSDVIGDLIEILKQQLVYFEIYTKGGILVESQISGILEREKRGIQDLDVAIDWVDHIIDMQNRQHGLLHVSNYNEIDYTDLEVYKLFVLSFEKPKRNILQSILKNRNDISITSSGKQKIEIAHPNANKGYGLKQMADYFNIPLKHTVAIGDNYNDVPMFSIAGMCIAMENAEDEVKQHATYITKHHENNGVGYALRKYILEE